MCVDLRRAGRAMEPCRKLSLEPDPSDLERATLGLGRKRFG